MDTGVRGRYRTRRALVLLLSMGVGALAGAPSAALASGGDPTDAQYNSTATQILPNDPGTPSGSAAGSLPFTGLDLAALAAVAAALGVGGLALRRQLARPDGESRS